MNDALVLASFTWTPYPYHATCSVAGVPGFVAAGFRHFRSLRTLQRDHGWLASLLEEAENERMHLFVCLKMYVAVPPPPSPGPCRSVCVLGGW